MICCNIKITRNVIENTSAEEIVYVRSRDLFSRLGRRHCRRDVHFHHYRRASLSWLSRDGAGREGEFRGGRFFIAPRRASDCFSAKRFSETPGGGEKNSRFPARTAQSPACQSFRHGCSSHWR